MATDAPSAPSTPDPIGSEPPTDPALTARAQRLLGYLEGLHRLRHPRPLDAIPADAVTAPSLPDHAGVRFKADADVLIEIDRVEAPTRPDVPSALADRIDWLDALKRPRLRPPAPPATDIDIDIDIDIEDDAAVAGISAAEAKATAQFEDWLTTVWDPWFEIARPILETRRLFLTLYDQRLAAERDLATHEVVWARGVAVGPPVDGERVRLPLFVRPVRYELDDQTGCLRVVATGPARLEIDPFELLIDTFDLVKRIESELYTDAPADAASSPADGASPELSSDGGLEAEPELDPALVEHDVMERLAKVIADAEFVPVAEAIGDATDHWRLVDIGCLFHRRRPVRYEAYFDALGAALDQGYLPDTWAAILADEPTAAPLSQLIGSNQQPWATLDDRILSPLPLNLQQRSILSRLTNRAGVTVQGPPGTGKSYAIAALTSHFLTHGLRVLICAEKPHPLTVIRDKMPEDLRRLCVAVLGDDRASNQQLEASIGAITARVNAVDADRDQADLLDLDGHLDQVRQRLDDLRSRELAIRQSEQQTLRLDGEEFGVADAARLVASSAADDGWLPDEVAPDTRLPLDRTLLAELLDLTRRLTADERRRHGLPLLSLDQLHSGAVLVECWHNLDRAEATIDEVASVVDLDAVATAGRPHLDAVLVQVAEHRQRVGWAASEWAPVHRAMAASEPQRGRWRQLAERMATEAQEAADLGLALAAHQVTYPARIGGQDPGPVLAELRTRFAAGKGLPRLGGGELKELVAAIAIDGRQPATVADLDLVESARKRDEHRRRLINLWAGELVPLGLSDLDSARPEDAYQTNYQQALQELIDLPRSTADLRAAVTPLLAVPHAPDIGFDHVGGLDAVATRLGAASAVFQRNESAQWLDSFGTYVGGLAGSGHPTVAAFHRALVDRNSASWDLAAEETKRLHQLAPELDRHAELASAFEQAAPRWAQSLRHDEVELTPEQVEAAWRWRQLRHWIDEILGLGDLASVSTRIAEAEQEEQRLLTDVVSSRAWLQLARRTSGAQRSALETWAQAMARVGKGTGKHAARHRATAQRAMRSAQDAVPVWIMSISQAIDSFRPGSDLAFDVVIVDEASQAPLDALAVLGLGQRVLVVGDDKQISPTIITDETEADRLRRQHLADVPDADGFDIRTSLYDTAARRFPGVIQLQEHFRCLPEIVEFSNRLAYEGLIDPLRERHRDPDWPAVEAVAVADGYRDGAVNPPEVNAVVDLVTELLADPRLAPGGEYPDGATIGVVCMVGQEQAKAIRGRLIEEVAVEEIEARRIRVGSPYEFQGDERDVIIISMLDAPAAPSGPELVAEEQVQLADVPSPFDEPAPVDESGSVDRPGRTAPVAVKAPPGPTATGVTGAAAKSKAHQQRYNVAASRARDRLIVVHSFDPGQLTEDDLRRELVAFAQNPAVAAEPAHDLAGRCHSRFERDILQRLQALAAEADLTLDAQYPVAGYRIDFTVTDRKRQRVAVDCDGDTLRTVNQLTNDAERQRILERLGWRFARVRASEYYADPERAFDALTERLRGHGLDLSPTTEAPA